MAPCPPSDAFRVRTSDGWSLHVRRHAAQGERRGSALLLHAMMVDRRTWDRPRGQGFASMLAQAGWEVFAADFRGHGGSGPLPGQGGRWSYSDLVERDVPALVAAVRRAVPGQPLVVLGHSLGGHVTLASIGTGACPPPDALVLLSSCIWVPRLTSSWRHLAWRTLASALMVTLSIPRGYFPSRRLGIGTADESAPYMRHLVGGWFSGRWGPRRGADYLAAMGAIQIPVLAVYATGDRLACPPSQSRAWAEQIPADQLQVLTVGDGSGGMEYASGHMELVTDQRSRPAWEAVERWMRSPGDASQRDSG